MFGDDVFSFYLRHKGIDATAWGKLFKSNLFLDKRFPVGLAYEDFYIMPEIFSLANSLTMLDKEVYYYRVRQGSISRSFSEKTFDIVQGLGCGILSC